MKISETFNLFSLPSICVHFYNKVLLNVSNKHAPRIGTKLYLKYIRIC